MNSLLNNDGGWGGSILKRKCVDSIANVKFRFKIIETLQCPPISSAPVLEKDNFLYKKENMNDPS